MHYLYGPGGEKLGTYTLFNFAGYSYFQEEKTNVYFRQQLIWEGPLASGDGTGGALVLDRLGTAVVKDGQTYAYFPYGEPRVGTGDHFATYQRDATTNFDYAMNRYYSNVAGRFLTPDPYGGSAHAGAPQSWNHYTYAGNDPVNGSDPSGLNITWLPPAGGEEGPPQDLCDLYPNLCLAIDAGYGMLGAVNPLRNFYNDPYRQPIPTPPQPGKWIPPGLKPIVQSAVRRAEHDLQQPDCAALFGSNVQDPQAALDRAWNNNGIRAFTFGDGQPAGVGAFTQVGSNPVQNVIFIATNRYFFTGILANGQPASDATVFKGLTQFQIQEVILIHELLHYTGVVGDDNQNQTITLGNGQVVQGSEGVTAAVVQDCIKDSGGSTP